MRTALLGAGKSPVMRHFAESSRLTRPVVERYVAGGNHASAIDVAAKLLDSGRLVTLDFLGEDVTSREQADENLHAYQSLLAAISETGAGARIEVSLKLSAVGQAISRDGTKIALDNCREICASATRADTTVTLDMEDHTTTDATLATLADVRADFPSTGAVLQAYLRRTESDCQDLATAGSRVRLCKGAYAEPSSVAHRGKHVDLAYQRCLRILLAGPGYPMIATHDPAMISDAGQLINTSGRQPDTYEFQMLLGVRTDEQLTLANRGHQMRVYTPFGHQWYGYFMRRLAERPANLRFFLRSLHS